jgi:hypothetical protein
MWSGLPDHIFNQAHELLHDVSAALSNAENDLC